MAKKKRHSKTNKGSASKRRTNVDEETFRQQIKIQWEDHFQTRVQTWKALQMNAAMVLAIIAVDFKFENTYVLLCLGLIALSVAVFGILLTIHHRRVQLEKFNYITRFEKKLKLHKVDLLGPKEETDLSEFRWWHILFKGKKTEREAEKSEPGKKEVNGLRTLLAIFRWWHILFIGKKTERKAEKDEPGKNEVKELRTPQFIFLCHLALLIFILIYIGIRIVVGSAKSQSEDNQISLVKRKTAFSPTSISHLLALPQCSIASATRSIREAEDGRGPGQPIGLIRNRNNKCKCCQ